jgi:uncharacterized protein
MPPLDPFRAGASSRWVGSSRVARSGTRGCATVAVTTWQRRIERGAVLTLARQPDRYEAVAPDERLGSVDCLRGLALFGVLVINLEREFRVSIFAQFLPAEAERGLDAWIDAALTILVDGKAFALFSLLFGIGLAIQHERLAASGRRAVLLIRRMLALLAFGLIHAIFIWNGDILTEYAVAGMIVIPLLYTRLWGPAVGAGFFLTLYILRPWWTSIAPFPTTSWLADHVTAAGHAYGSGDYVQIFVFRLQELPAILPLHVYIFPRTLALMLLGALIWRVGLFKRAEELSAWLRWGAATLIAAGLVLTMATSGRAYSGWPAIGRADVVAASLAPLLLAFGYSALILALGNELRRRGLAWAEPVGRMAFTNYVMQSVVLGFIFYGYGLGLFGRLSLTAGLAVALVVYGTQIIISRVWLRRFRYGPLEWLWRTLMYGSAPGLLRPKPERAPTC